MSPQFMATLSGVRPAWLPEPPPVKLDIEDRPMRKRNVSAGMNAYINARVEKSKARWKAAFDAHPVMTAPILAKFMGCKVSQAISWLNKKQGELVQKCGEIQAVGSHTSQTWEWIEGC